MPKKRKSNSQAGILKGDAPVLTTPHVPKKSRWDFLTRPGFVIPLNILIILYIALNLSIYLYGTKLFAFHPGVKNVISSISIIKDQSEVTFINSPTPTPQTAYNLPSGRQEYTFSHGPGVTGPKIQTATIDPLAPKQGGVVSLTITVTHGTPVTKATATLYTDKTHRTFPLTLAAGTPTDGTWTTSWNMTDTYYFTYHINIHLESDTGNWDGALTFR